MSQSINEEKAYGCIFTITGKEMEAAKFIKQSTDDIQVMIARQAKRKTVQGKTSVEEALLFPGYIFFEAPCRMEIIKKLTIEKRTTVLTYGTGDWRLYGNDAKAVKWLFMHDGLVSFSKAYQEGDKIRIISGPLKDLEGQILRIVKRDRSAQVGINFFNRVVKVWLAFDIVERIEALGEKPSAHLGVI